jgi:hypothetical protein
MLSELEVSWKSRLQLTTEASTVEAEYMAAAFTTREAMWIHKLVADVDHPVEPLRIWDDNQGVIN